MKRNINVGIIDDDQGKISSICTKLKYPEFSSKSREDSYGNTKIIPTGVKIENNLEDMLENVLSNNFYDALLIDYKLASQSSAGYNGIELAKEILNSKSNIPIFILTSYEDELFNNEKFSSYQIFDVERFLNDRDEREEIYIKIIKQLEFVEQQLTDWKEELLKLKEIESKNSSELSRFIELDNLIEKTVSGNNKLNTVKKLESESKKFDSLLEKIEKLISDDVK